MSLTLVIKKEFRDVRRSRMLWGLLGLCLGFMFLLLAVLELWGPDSPTGSELLEFFAGFGGQLLFPILALVIGYMALVGERQSGSLRILHGLPHSRKDILFGKFIGRAAVITAVVGASFVAVTVFGLLLIDSVSIREVTLVAVVTALNTVTFVGIAVGVSAVAASRGRAMAGAIGTYLLFAIIWEPLVAGVHYAMEGSLVGLEAPAWYFLLRRFSPIYAYTDLMSVVLDTHIQNVFSWPVEQIPREAFERDGALLVSNRVTGELPLYLEGWSAATVFAGWVFLALAVGYRSFTQTDIA